MARSGSGWALVACAVTVFAGDAFAGARPYAFVQGAQSLPETSLELESWFGASRPGASASTWDWWFGPVVGISDQLEVGVFSIFRQPPGVADNGAVMQLSSFRAQVSYLLAERGAWPVDVRLRVEFGQPVAKEDFGAWFEAILSRDFGQANVTLNTSAWLKSPRTNFSVEPYLDVRLGGSYQVLPGLHVGAEAFGVTGFGDEEDERPVFDLGPSVSYGTGRLWASASYGVGLTPTSSRQGRLVVGLAF